MDITWTNIRKLFFLSAAICNAASIINEPSGSLSSMTYEPSQTCVTTIEAPAGANVTLSFTEFVMNAPVGSLTIFDGHAANVR